MNVVEEHDKSLIRKCDNLRKAATRAKKVENRRHVRVTGAPSPLSQRDCTSFDNQGAPTGTGTTGGLERANLRRRHP